MKEQLEDLAETVSEAGKAVTEKETWVRSFNRQALFMVAGATIGTMVVLGLADYFAGRPSLTAGLVQYIPQEWR